MPPLFISHGSPQLLIDDTAARAFLSGYAATLPRPRAIVIASAHFGTSRPAVVGDAEPGMIHPTEEHLLPLFIALGAGEGGAGRRIHSSYRNGVIAMDTYAFG